MSNQSPQINAKVVKFTTTGTTPSNYADETHGGWREVATDASLNNIPDAHLSIGMAVRVTGTSKTYLYGGINPNTDERIWNEIVILTKTEYDNLNNELEELRNLAYAGL